MTTQDKEEPMAIGKQEHAILETEERGKEKKTLASTGVDEQDNSINNAISE